MSRGPNSSSSAAVSSPSSPSVVVPGLMAVAALGVCWLTEDPAVLRAAATVVVVLAFFVVGSLSRHVDKVVDTHTAELRARSRDVTRLREATNEILEQMTTQRDEMARFREDTSDVREEAASLLEVVESRLPGGLIGDTTSPFPQRAGSPYSGPMTGPQVAPSPTPPPPAAAPFSPPQRGDTSPTGAPPTPMPLGSGHPSPAASAPAASAPPASAPPASAPPAPAPSAPAASPTFGDADQGGYLESFSLDEDQPLTDYWSRSGAHDDDVPRWATEGDGPPPERWW